MARSRELKVVLTGDPTSLNRAFAKAGSGADKMGSRVSGAAKLAGAALAGGLVIGAKKAVDAFGEAEKVAAQTRATLKSTGGVAKVTAKDIGDLATAISRKSGIDDEAIQSGANLLLTFTKVRNEVGAGNAIFDRATQTVADFSVTFKKDLTGSAILVGKALNDPVKGLSALSRVGVQFTKQQKQQIETLVDSGRTLDAQKVILKELEVQTKGAAAAYGDTLPGKIDKAKVAVGNLQEAIGGALAPAVASAADGIASFVSNLTTSDRPAEFFKAVGGQVSDLKDAIGGIFDDFGKRRGAGDSFAAALGGTIADAVSNVNWDAVGDTISTGFTKGADFTGKLAPAVATGISSALGQINGRDLLAGLLRVVSEGINALFSPSFWVDNFAAIFSTVTIAIPVAKILKIPGADFLFRHISKPIFGAVGKLAGGLVGLFGKMGSSATTGFLASLERLAPRTANLLLGLVTGSGKWLSGLPGKFKGAALGAIGSMTDGITRGAGRVGGAVGSLTGKIVSTLGKAASAMFRAGWDIAKSILNGILRGIGHGIGKVGGVIKKGIGAVGGFLGIGEGIGKSLRPSLPGGKGSANLKGANPALGPFAALGAKAGLSVSSGMRGGAVTSSGNVSYHSTGEAIDLAGPAGSMLSFARAMKSRYGGRLAELIYTPMGAGIKNGRAHTFSGKVASDHYDHVHLALDLGMPGPGIGDGGRTGDGIGVAAAAARKAGFSGTELVNMVAIAGRESGYNPRAQNLKYPDHSIGLWQINQLAHKGKFGTDAALMNPITNARAARALFKAGGYSPWKGPSGSWTDGIDAELFKRARSAVLGSRKASSRSTGTRGDRGSASTRGPGSQVTPGRFPSGGTVTSGSPSYEQDLAEADVSVAEAERQPNVAAQVVAQNRRRGVVKTRLNKVTAALRKKGLRPATRLRLTQERASLLGELGSIDSTVRELTTPADSGDDPNQALIDAHQAWIDAIEAKAEQDRQLAEEAAARERERIESMNALKASIDANTAFANQVSAITSREAVRALVDVMTGQLGARVVQRGTMPGSGLTHSLGRS